MSRAQGRSVSHPLVPDSLQPMDRSLPGPSVHGILQARTLEFLLQGYVMSKYRGTVSPLFRRK